MTVSHELEARRVSFVLPVTLSREVRREVLIRTGTEPRARQFFVVKDLADIPSGLRERLVAVREAVDVHIDGQETETLTGPYWGRVNDARVDGFLWLQRSGADRWERYLPGTEGDSVGVDEVFYPGDGRTIDALEQLRATLEGAEVAVLDAMLDGAPLVTALGRGGVLRAEDVLEAYDRALVVAQQMIDVIDAGTRARRVSWTSGSHVVTDEAIFLCPDYGVEQPTRLAAILKQASPDAYCRGRELLEGLHSVPVGIVAEKIDRVCFHWWSANYARASDEWKVENLLEITVANAQSDARAFEADKQTRDQYEKDRSRWIADHGSQRLRRAAARGYRHDGIYLDERLHLELPGFVGSLGRKAKTRELVNPSERALELEAEVLVVVEELGIAEEQVRLVYAQPGDDVDWMDGEFVQIEGYLGRHTVWQSVSGQRANDDLPF
jgi:hypothetical protein